MRNLVRELEAEGVIPRGRFVAVCKESELGNVHIVKAADKRLGMCTIKPLRMVLPEFVKIQKDSNGNYVCIGMKDNKYFVKVYDKELLPVELKTEGLVSTKKVKEKREQDVRIFKENNKFGLANSSCIIFPKFLRIDLTKEGNFICYFEDNGKLCYEMYDNELNLVKNAKANVSQETTAIWPMADGATFVAANDKGVFKRVYRIDN